MKWNKRERENFVKYFEIMRFVNMIPVSYCRIGAGLRILSVTRYLVALTLQPPEWRRWLPGSGRSGSRWWCPCRGACILCGCERRNARLQNERPPLGPSSSPRGDGTSITRRIWQTHSCVCGCVGCVGWLSAVSTYMSKLPVVWVVLQIKDTFREELDFSQGFRGAFLNATGNVYWFALAW